MMAKKIRGWVGVKGTLSLKDEMCSLFARFEYKRDAITPL